MAREARRPLAQAVRPDALHRPHPARFDPARPDHDAALTAHAAALEAGEAGYLDPATGLFVLTAAYLVDRGWCCDNGCRHCPYVGAPEGGAAPDEAAQSQGSSSA